MAPARLVLIRHAEIDCTSNGQSLLCGSHDAPLSKIGREQVDHLRTRLLTEIASAAYSSPLRRAIETALAVPYALVPSMRLLNSLAEIHCGRVEGMPIDQIRAEYPQLWAENEAQNNETFAWPGGESYRHFRHRVLRAIRCLAGRHAGQRVLIFTHAGVVNQILGTLAGQSAARWENLRPGNTSITEVFWNQHGGHLIVFDDRRHLRPD